MRSSDSIGPLAYLSWVGGGTVVVFILLWAYVALFPIAFLDQTYPGWLAKEEMLQSCDTGEVAILGDSRAVAGIVPKLMARKTTNLAFPGGSSIEAYFAARRVVQCGNRPKFVVVAISAERFTNFQSFWDSAVRYRFLSPDDISSVEAMERDTGDYSISLSTSSEGLPKSLRSFAYAFRTPFPYGNSLINGGFFLRAIPNIADLREIRGDRGHIFLSRGRAIGTVAIDAGLKSFVPRPFLDFYFSDLLALFAAEKIPVGILSIPINETTFAALDPAMVRDFTAYLSRRERPGSGIRLLGPALSA